MKNYAILMLALLAICGCQKNDDSDNIVSQRYIHKYGYAISQQEWVAKNYPGQVVTMLKNGVTITSTYENGILNGPQTHSYPHSQIIESYFLYNQGNLVKEINYDPRGMPLRETTQLSSTRHTTTLWYADGTPMSIEEYINDELMDGQYFTTTNEVETRVEKGNGLRVRRDQKGVLLSKDKMEGGYLAKRESFYPSGTPESVSYYSKGKLHGERKSFAETGEPVAVEEYINGMLHGRSMYYKNGNKSHEVSFIEGRKNGKEVHFLDGDKISEEIAWEDDMQHGPATYYIDGDAETKWYYGGKLTSEKRFHDMIRIDAKINQIAIND